MGSWWRHHKNRKRIMYGKGAGKSLEDSAMNSDVMVENGLSQRLSYAWDSLINVISTHNIIIHKPLIQKVIVGIYIKKISVTTYKKQSFADKE